MIPSRKTGRAGFTDQVESAAVTTASPTPPLSGPVRAAILGLGITQIIGFGTTYYLLGLLGPPIARDLGLPKAVILAGISVTFIASALLGPLAGRLQDQIGSRLVMACGSMIMALGLFLLSRAEGPVLYFLAWGVIALGTPLSLYNAAFTAITRMAGRNARRAIVILTLLGGLASTIIWPVTAMLLSVWSWRDIVLGYALINLLVCVPAHALLLEGRTPDSEQNGASDPIAPGIPEHAALKAFILLTIMLSLISLVGNGWSMLVFPVLDGLGFESGQAVLVASLVGVFQVLGRVGEMASAGRHSALRTAQISNSLFAIGFAFLIVSGGSLAMGIAFAAAYGIANGLNTIVKGALTLQLYGSLGYGERLGKITLAPGLCAALAPILGGLVLDLQGARGLSILFLMLGCAAMAMMILLTRHCHANGMR